jgi:hypothetical protein
VTDVEQSSSSPPPLTKSPMKYVGLPQRKRRVGVRRRLSSWDEDIPAVYDLTVYDDTSEYIDTGLVFPDGEPIYRPCRELLGFIHFEEEESE